MESGTRAQRVVTLESWPGGKEAAIVRGARARGGENIGTRLPVRQC